MAEPKQINFTIVPDAPESHERVYSNFCAVARTPFDVTLSFCDVLPLTARDLEEAEREHVVRAPVRVNVVIPFAMVPTLVTALQEQMRAAAEPGSEDTDFRIKH